MPHPRSIAQVFGSSNSCGSGGFAGLSYRQRPEYWLRYPRRYYPFSFHSRSYAVRSKW